MKKILNFGSLNLDHVYSVEHFVQPGETLAADKYEIFPGGKGLNQSIALALAGGEVYHAGRIGPDGAWLAELLRERGVDTGWIDTSGDSTGHAIIQVSRKGQNCILLHGGANRDITPQHIRRVFDAFGEGDLLVLQNEVNGLEEMIAAASGKGMDIAINPSPLNDAIPYHALDKVKWFLLNEIEGHGITGETGPEKICGKLLDRIPKAKIVLTLGKEGVLYMDKQATYTHGIYDVPVVDTTAAGDTFTGYFLSSVVNGKPIPEALRLASIASSIAVSRKGAAISIPFLKEAEEWDGA